ncbi:MAG TPA: hypothetical protein VKF17_09105 [Isosphaeraceae bacterium]|nr:hypothetical protein [Isosphaeraceae bacterium]
MPRSQGVFELAGRVQGVGPLGPAGGRASQTRTVKSPEPETSRVPSGLQATEGPGLLLWTHRDDIGPEKDPTHRNWIQRMAATFPPEVYLTFAPLPIYHANGR